MGQWQGLWLVQSTQFRVLATDEVEARERSRLTHLTFHYGRSFRSRLHMSQFELLAAFTRKY